MDDNKCTTFSSNIKSYFIPPLEIFSTLCISYDKTALFITSIIRLIFYVGLMNVFMSYYPNNYNYIYYILLGIVLINIIYIAFLLMKMPKFSKNSLN